MQLFFCKVVLFMFVFFVFCFLFVFWFVQKYFSNCIIFLLCLIDKDGNTALHIACIANNYHAARNLLEKYKEQPVNKQFNNKRETPLSIAASKRDATWLELLLPSAQFDSIGYV